MKHVYFFAILLAGTMQVHAENKQDCSVFYANLIGLEPALKTCALTPRFLAWVKEERIRLEREKLAAQKEAQK